MKGLLIAASDRTGEADNKTKSVFLLCSFLLFQLFISAMSLLVVIECGSWSNDDADESLPNCVRHSVLASAHLSEDCDRLKFISSLSSSAYYRPRQTISLSSVYMLYKLQLSCGSRVCEQLLFLDMKIIHESTNRKCSILEHE